MCLCVLLTVMCAFWVCACMFDEFCMWCMYVLFACVRDVFVFVVCV